MNVLCTYQGSFSPPTLGHEDAARIIARKLIELYATSPRIQLLFMPTSNVGSKESLSYKKAAEGHGTEPSDYVSEKERFDMLNILCGRLNGEFGGRIQFEVSIIEFKQPEKGTSTIHTLRALHSDEYALVLAMGEDNGRQLPWWSNIEEYPKLIDAMLYIDREPSIDAKYTSDLRYHETYNPHKCCMRFDSGWPITLNGVKKSYEFPDIMSSLDSHISDALKALAEKTYLLPAPLPVSSTALRKALRSGNMAEVEAIDGKDVLEYIIPRNICTRTKDDVRRDLMKLGGGGSGGSGGGSGSSTRKHNSSSTVGMNKQPLLDLPALSTRINQIAKTYASDTPVVPLTESDKLFDSLQPIIRKILYESAIKDSNYWKKEGVRVESAANFAQCLNTVKERMTAVGSGAFGTMYDVPVAACMKNLPRGVKHVGIKIEKISGIFESHQTPQRVKEVAKIAKKAAKLKIGPEFYDMFVTENEHHQAVIIKIFELINGKTWENTEWSSPEKKHKAAERLKEAIHTMNKAGILHHDLHPGNVMIHKSGKVYIIDYDRATIADNAELNTLPYFNDSIPYEWSMKGAMSDNGILYIYTKLVEEGTILLNDTKPAPIHNNKTRKRR